MSVDLTHVSKSFGSFLAVNDVSLSIEDGEFFVLLGPSGCGKTTTLRMIAGLELPSTGQIRIHGRDVTYTEPRHRDIAMAFQDYGLYPHLTVANNIGFPLRVRGVDRRQRAAKVAETAERLGIGQLLHRKPSQLSGGERQRVSLARALVRNPRVFLMDEPLSNLDAKLRAVMRTEIKKLVSSMGITTIYVTHDQIEAMAMADRIAVMSCGNLAQVGAPLDIYDRPNTRFVAEFMGSPPMNLIEAKVDTERTLDCPLAYLAKSVPDSERARLNGTLATGAAVSIGIRPEHLIVDPNVEAEGDVAAVEFVEALGQLTNIYLSTEAGPIVAVADRTDVKVGNAVRVRALRERLRLIPS